MNRSASSDKSPPGMVSLMPPLSSSARPIGMAKALASSARRETVGTIPGSYHARRSAVGKGDVQHPDPGGIQHPHFRPVLPKLLADPVSRILRIADKPEASIRAFECPVVEYSF